MVEEYLLIMGVIVEVLPTLSLSLKRDLRQVICLSVFNASMCLNVCAGKMRIILVPNLYDCHED